MERMEASTHGDTAWYRSGMLVANLAYGARITCTLGGTVSFSRTRDDQPICQEEPMLWCTVMLCITPLDRFQ